MSAADISNLVSLSFIAGAALFVIGLHQMNSPATARTGNKISATGMVIAITAELIHAMQGGMGLANWGVLIVGLAAGAGVGLYLARNIGMTSMPQLVSLFNAVGGGAAALLAINDFIGLDGQRVLAGGAPGLDGWRTLFIIADVVIGSVTFTGSLIASGKLMGIVASRPVHIPMGRILSGILVIVGLAASVVLILAGAGVRTYDTGILEILLVTALVCALLFGILMVLPIGGADMPVVISLLNAFTGTAVAMAGFVLVNPVLIISGALVGASGGILTKLMADAMNRSILNIMIGGFGGGEGTVGSAGGGATQVRSVSADDAAIQMAYASSVIIVPGYGLAVAQAQHACRELGELLESKGVDVKYAIHPVAGRMPGHMNVLLAEANVPYPLLKEMDDINPEFDRCDVALVVGANDVTNPAARRPGSPVSGMPILNVDHAKSIIVIKRSMGRGYAGIDNELYGNPKTGMLFADAKDGLGQLVAALKAL